MSWKGLLEVSVSQRPRSKCWSWALAGLCDFFSPPGMPCSSLYHGACCSHTHPPWPWFWSSLTGWFLIPDSVPPFSPPTPNLALPSLVLFSFYSLNLTHSTVTPPTDDSKASAQLYNSRFLGETPYLVWTLGLFTLELTYLAYPPLMVKSDLISKRIYSYLVLHSTNFYLAFYIFYSFICIFYLLPKYKSYEGKIFKNLLCLYYIFSSQCINIVHALQISF